MKTKLFIATLTLLFATSFAQDKTTVNAMSSEISDNLDLRSIASIFGDSENLDDFEKRINDPKSQISNLDLNNDNQVDYLRVIESVEGRTHLIVVQSVLGRDMFQDVATIEVEKDTNNRIQVQVVGDVYMYGDNYIYEPVYVHTPIIYTHFWASSYRPYCSTWYWGYYPTYYTFWQPYPVFRYRHNIAMMINFNHQYNYVNNRRCLVAYNNYYSHRGNYYEKQNPNRSFTVRNSGYTNRHDLEQTRSTSRKDVAFSNTRGNDRNTKIDATTRSNQSIRTNGATPVRETTRSNQAISTNEATPVRETTRSNQSIRTNEATPVRETTRSNQSIRTNEATPVRETTRNQATNQSATTRQTSNTRNENSSSGTMSSSSRSSSSNTSSSRGNSSNGRR